MKGIQPSLLVRTTPKGRLFISEEDDESVDSKSKPSKDLETKVPLLLNSSLASSMGAKPYRVRIATALTQGPGATAGVATSKVSWDPTSTGQFSSFAGLFSEYRVEAVIVKLWGTTQAQGNNATPLALVVSSDPGALVSTVTQALAAETMGARFYNGLTTSRMAISHRSDGAKAPVTPLTRDGFAKVATPWTGQTLIVGDTGSGAGTAALYSYQVLFTIIFRCRA